MKLYGSLNNRLEENKQFCDEIKVGTGATRYSYSDRHPYEVTAVRDQNHVTIRELDHKPAENAQPYSNDWELTSNEKNPTTDLVRRGNYWYQELTATTADLEAAEERDENGKYTENALNLKLWMYHNDFDPEKIQAKGKQTKYRKIDISFGKAEYYYDYEF